MTNQSFLGHAIESRPNIPAGEFLKPSSYDINRNFDGIEHGEPYDFTHWV